MPRVKRGVASHRRHKKILKLAKGYRGKRKNVFKLAKNAVMKAGMNAYRDRRLKKRSFHQLWVLRINAACRMNDMKYSRFIYGLELANIQVNRKMLAELAVNHEAVFEKLVEAAKKALPEPGKAPDLAELKKRYGAAEKTVKKAEEKAEEKKEEKATAKPAAKKAPAKKKEEK